MKTRFCTYIIMGLWMVSASVSAWAEPDQAVFLSAIVYRGDGEGDYTFKESGKLNGATIADDGAVEYKASPGTYEITAPYVTKGNILSVTANWQFSGEATLEFSATGNSADYATIVNGVPLDLDAGKTGTQLKWKATLAPGSRLTQVRLTYMDATGVLGGFGTAELSGFMFRAPIYITGSADGELFHYQLPIKIGESSKAEGCDVHLKGVVQADFDDVRFTLTDQETLIPHYREYVTGAEPGRAALFYVKIPQLPKEGLLIYLYYGKAYAEDMSDGKATFDFFDDFEGEALDAAKWNSSLDSESSFLEVSDSRLRLDGAKITSKEYEFKGGIIEYKAESGAAALAAIIKGSAQAGSDRIAYSSAHAEAEHSIAIGTYVKANDGKPIPFNKYNIYRVTQDGDEITFQRYDESGADLEAEAKYNDAGGPESGYIGLFATSEESGAYYDYVRVRKYAALPPEVDRGKTAMTLEEVPNIAEFENVTVAPNGDLTLAEGYAEGQYISQLLRAPFRARIIVPSWLGEAAEGSSFSIDISAKEYGLYTKDCLSGAYYYASKKDFTEGDALRWRARFSADPVMRQNKYYLFCLIKRVGVDFRDGNIELIKPNGGEALAVGSEYAIVWDAYDYEPSYKMKLEYSIDGGKDYNNIAAVTNSGRYTWRVPGVVSELAGERVSGLTREPANPQTGSQKCLVRISDSLEPAVYDVSNNYFAIRVEAAEPSLRGAEGDEVISEEALAEEEIDTSRPRPGTEPYELLIMIKDKEASRAKEQESGYKEGDIVMIKPEGFLWGAEEREKFLIVKAYLTKEEAVELMKPKELDGKIIQKRMYKIDLGKQGLMDQKRQALKGLLASKPLIDIEGIELREGAPYTPPKAERAVLPAPKPAEAEKPLPGLLQRLKDRAKPRVTIKELGR